MNMTKKSWFFVAVAVVVVAVTLLSLTAVMAKTNAVATAATRVSPMHTSGMMMPANCPYHTNGADMPANCPMHGTTSAQKDK